MLQAILALAPILLEILKIFAGSGKPEQEKIKQELLEYVRRVQDAAKKASETGDTSDLENIINKK